MNPTDAPQRQSDWTHTQHLRWYLRSTRQIRASQTMLQDPALALANLVRTAPPRALVAITKLYTLRECSPKDGSTARLKCAPVNQHRRWYLPSKWGPLHALIRTSEGGTCGGISHHRTTTTGVGGGRLGIVTNAYTEAIHT